MLYNARKTRGRYRYQQAPQNAQDGAKDGGKRQQTRCARGATEREGKKTLSAPSVKMQKITFCAFCEDWRGIKSPSAPSVTKK